MEGSSLNYGDISDMSNFIGQAGLRAEVSQPRGATHLPRLRGGGGCRLGRRCRCRPHSPRTLQGNHTNFHDLVNQRHSLQLLVVVLDTCLVFTEPNARGKCQKERQRGLPSLPARDPHFPQPQIYLAPKSSSDRNRASLGVAIAAI